jgi:hypothetical protein
VCLAGCSCVVVGDVTLHDEPKLRAAAECTAVVCLVVVGFPAGAFSWWGRFACADLEHKANVVVGGNGVPCDGVGLFGGW